MCVKILTKRNAVHAFDPFYEAIPLKQEEGVPSSGGQRWARVGKGGQRAGKGKGKIQERLELEYLRSNSFRTHMAS